MDVAVILQNAVNCGASDIFVVAGMPVTYKINGKVERTSDGILLPEQTRQFVEGVYRCAGERDISKLLNKGDDDFSFALKGVSRFRASAYKQRGSLAIVIRVVRFTLPDPAELNIPNAVLGLSNLSKGLVLVTGAAGSGKSTTLACLIDRINRTQNGHIITLEDPLEFLHSHNKSIVSQREVPEDTESYVTALKAALRQSPDVILLGELRDYDTINVAMTAAETGHLIFSTLHTVGAVHSIDRIIDAFQPNQQHQIRMQLAMVLQAVVSQQLVPTVDGKEIPAFEIMIANNAIRTMIREAKTHQLENAIVAGAAEGMITMDASLLQLYKAGKITEETALSYSSSPEALKKKLNMSK